MFIVRMRCFDLNIVKASIAMGSVYRLLA